jgi:hypothetical protein
MAQVEPVEEAPKEPQNERTEARTAVRRCGWVSRTKGEQLRECVVLDESNKGARIAIGATSEIPDEFYIYMSLESSSRRRCRVAWRTDKEIGIEFLG